MWEYALWGVVGAVANRGVIFLEATQRVKGWPWAQPKGPGGGVYTASIFVHLGIAAAASAALSTMLKSPSGFIAFGVGVVAPVIVKKAGRYAEALLPPPGVNKRRSLGGGGDG
jgi:hypothetical protein